MACGKGVRSGEHVTGAGLEDIAPTILYMLGLPVPTSMDGRILQDVLTDDFRASHEVRRSDDDGAIEAGSDLGRDDEEEIEERLRGLGYL